jgi:cytochrome bd-type quinol oxidase subunit 2
MDVTNIAAIVYATITLGVVGFQMALAAGAPWGAYAMGGAYPGKFPSKMRVAAIIQAVILAGMAAVVLARSGLILPEWFKASRWLVWVVMSIMAVGLVLNLITPSAKERNIWAPVVSLLLICCLIVIFTGP